MAKHVLSDAAGGVEGARIEGPSFDTPVRQAHRLLRMSGWGGRSRNRPTANSSLLYNDKCNRPATPVALSTQFRHKAPGRGSTSVTSRRALPSLPVTNDWPQASVRGGFGPAAPSEVEMRAGRSVLQGG